MNAEEIARFESDEFAGDAVRLRRWDDLAKIPGKDVPPLDRYRAVLESVLKSQRGIRYASVFDATSDNS